MKNKILLRLAAFTALFFALAFSPSKMNAQSCADYTIKNLLACDIKVSYVFSCVGGGTCASGSNVVVPTGRTIVVHACPSCASGNCQMSVTLTQVGGTTLSSPVTVNAGNTSGTFPTGLCPGSAGTINWSLNLTTIQ